MHHFADEGTFWGDKLTCPWFCSQNWNLGSPRSGRATLLAPGRTDSCLLSPEALPEPDLQASYRGLRASALRPGAAAPEDKGASGTCWQEVSSRTESALWGAGLNCSPEMTVPGAEPTGQQGPVVMFKRSSQGCREAGRWGGLAGRAPGCSLPHTLQDSLLSPVLLDGTPVHFIDGRAEAPKGKVWVNPRGSGATYWLPPSCWPRTEAACVEGHRRGRSACRHARRVVCSRCCSG